MHEVSGTRSFIFVVVSIIVGRLCMKSQEPAVFIRINETPEFYFN